MAQSDLGTLCQKNRLLYGGKEIKEPKEAKLVLRAAFKDLSKVFTIRENNNQLLIVLHSHNMIEDADFHRFNQYGDYTDWNIRFYELLRSKSDLPKVLSKLVNLNDPDLSEYQKHINQIFTSISTLKEKVSITDKVEDFEKAQRTKNENSTLVENQHVANIDNGFLGNILNTSKSENPTHHLTTPEQEDSAKCPYLNVFSLSLFLAIVIGMLVIIYFIMVSSCSCSEKESCEKSANFISDEQQASKSDKIIKGRNMQSPTKDLGLYYNILVSRPDELTQQQFQICSSSVVNLTIDFKVPKEWHDVRLGCTDKIKILIFKGFFSLRNVEELLSQLPKDIFAVEIYCDNICVATEGTVKQYDSSEAFVNKSFNILTLWASEETSDCNTVIEYLGNNSRFSFSKLQPTGITFTTENIKFINQILNTQV